MVVYYSLGGATKIYAETLSELTNDTLFELRETKTRSSGILGVILGGAEAMLGVNTSLEQLPEIQAGKPLFICSPIWAGRLGPAVMTFIKNTDLTRRKVNIILTCSNITKRDAYKSKVTEQLLLQKCTPGFVQVFACDKKSAPDKITVRKHLKKLVLKVDESF